MGLGFGLGLGVRVRVRVRVSAAEVDHPCEEGVHGADVVEHVLVVHRGAHEEDEEVEPAVRVRVRVRKSGACIQCAQS